MFSIQFILRNWYRLLAKMQRQLKCFFLLGTVLITLFIIGWDSRSERTFYQQTASSPDLTHLKIRQEHRRRFIRELCSASSSLNFTEKSMTFDQIPNKALDHLIVDDHHGVIYCFVPKVACTNWKRIMIVLSQNLKAPDGAPYLDPLDIPYKIVHNSTVHIVLFCFIVCYLLNMLLFYLKYDVCSQNVTYNLINMLKVFQSIGQYWSVSVNLNNPMNFGWRPRI